MKDNALGAVAVHSPHEQPAGKCKERLGTHINTHTVLKLPHRVVCPGNQQAPRGVATHLQTDKRGIGNALRGAAISLQHISVLAQWAGRPAPEASTVAGSLTNRLLVSRHEPREQHNEKNKTKTIETKAGKTPYLLSRHKTQKQKQQKRN